jgi:hypothetical protein
MKRAFASLAALLSVLLCVGCATQTDFQFDPALFAHPPVAAGGRVPGRVAVWMPSHVTRMVEAKTLLEAVRVPIGGIVEGATQAAADDAFQGRAVLLQAPPVPGSGFDAILVVDAVRLSVEEKFEAAPDPILPFLRPPTRVTYGHLAFDLSLLDSQGRKLWTRSYDAGREMWYPPVLWTQSRAPLATLPATYNVMVRCHQAAWRLAQQVATDVSDWLAAERIKPREL